MKQIRVGDMEVNIIRSKRRTVALQISPAGEIVVRAPLRYPERSIVSFVAEKEGWIKKHLPNSRGCGENEGAEPFGPEDIRKMQKLAKKIIPERVEYYARFVGVDYGRVAIRSQKTRWGSCSSVGNLNFNCLLVMVPGEVMDYVIVHELCHRLEMNHSRRFWAEVERVMPDYRERRAWLRQNGNSLIARMVAGKEQM